jgi:ribosomal protein S18 acetylase RimI-like enzyme
MKLHIVRPMARLVKHPRLVKRPGLDEVLAFCAEDPVERVFLEDVARLHLGRLVALRDEQRLTALCYVGTNVVPSGRGTEAFARIALAAHPRMIVGEEQAVGDLWEAIGGRLPAPRADRPGQPVYVLEEAPPEAGTGIRPATVDDLPLLVPASAEAFLEEVGVDAYARDSALFTERTRTQIEEGRSWLWEEGGRILFKAEASAWTPHAVQLQQVWVDPGLRGRGFGKRGLADLCALLLDRVPAVCLFVRPENAPAIALYEAIGMRRVGAYRSLIFG